MGYVLEKAAHPRDGIAVALAAWVGLIDEAGTANATSAVSTARRRSDVNTHATPSFRRRSPSALAGTIVEQATTLAGLPKPRMAIAVTAADSRQRLLIRGREHFPPGDVRRVRCRYRPARPCRATDPRKHSPCLRSRRACKQL
jgi:hypothetical protein